MNVEERKKKLQDQKMKLENEIKKMQSKLKIINQELINIRTQEKVKNVDEIIDSLKEQGIEDIETLLKYVKQGKVTIK